MTPSIDREWLAGAVRVRFPHLARAVGGPTFDAMIAAYLPRGGRLADYLAAAPEYPVWCAELAALERARAEVLHAPATTSLVRSELAFDRVLRPIRAHAVVELTTACDELVAGRAHDPPRALDYPRHVLVWRTGGLAVHQRALEPDEVHLLRALERGLTLDGLAADLPGENPHARALDLLVRWIDAGLIAR